MKNIINSFVLVLIAMFFSCKNCTERTVTKKTENKEKIDTIYIERNYKNVSYIDHELDSTIYKLDIGDSENYIVDNHNRKTILLTRNIFVGDSCFGGYSNIPKALKYSKKMNMKGQEYTRIAISILNKNEKFDEVWFWKRNGDYGGDNGDGFSVSAGRVFLEEGYYKYKNHTELGLKINYDYGFSDYKKINSLNFIKKKNKWKIISRESINTSPDESIHYFLEANNLYGKYEGELSDTFPPSEKIEITNEMIIFY